MLTQHNGHLSMRRQPRMYRSQPRLDNLEIIESIVVPHPKLEISFTEEETDDLFGACDINADLGIKLNEFIDLLCLVYLLKGDPTAFSMGMPKLEATFESLVTSFVFLGKIKDGYVNKCEKVEAINKSTSSGRIAMKRFNRWVGIDQNEDEDRGKTV